MASLTDHKGQRFLLEAMPAYAPPLNVVQQVMDRYAQAVGRQDRGGSLTPGKLADVLVLDTRDYRNFVYHFGVNLTHMVLKRGKRVKPGG